MPYWVRCSGGVLLGRGPGVYQIHPRDYMSLGVPPGKLEKVFGERSEFLCLDSCPMTWAKKSARR